MKNLLKGIVISSAIFIPITSCAPDIGESDYNLSEGRSISSVRTGVVTGVRKIKMHRKQKEAINEGMLVGAGTGAVVGGLMGQTPGQVNTGLALGALAGGAAGYFIDEKTRTQDAFEYIVRMDDTGQEISLPQGGAMISAGTRVRVYIPIQNSGASARIVPY